MLCWRWLFGNKTPISGPRWGGLQSTTAAHVRACVQSLFLVPAAPGLFVFASRSLFCKCLKNPLLLLNPGFVQNMPSRRWDIVAEDTKRQRFRGGLVLKAHRLLYHSTLGLKVIKKKKRQTCDVAFSRSLCISESCFSSFSDLFPKVRL